MRHPSTRALYAYWSRLKGQRCAPERSEIDPRALAAHLGDIFLLDNAASGHALRLSGSRMEAELGEKLTGQPFAALFAENARAEALHALASATLESEPILLGVRLASPTNENDAAGKNPAQMRPETGQWVRPQWRNQRPVPPPEGERERRFSRPSSGEMLLLPLAQRGIVGARVLGAFGLLSPSLQLPGTKVPLEVTGQRVLTPEALSLAGRGLARGASVMARGGIVSLLREDNLPPFPKNDA